MKTRNRPSYSGNDLCEIGERRHLIGLRSNELNARMINPIVLLEIQELNIHCFLSASAPNVLRVELVVVAAVQSVLVLTVLRVEPVMMGRRLVKAPIAMIALETFLFGTD
jgi:hypothetical protein